jgi:nicotinamide mononucleotide transporter
MKKNLKIIGWAASILSLVGLFFNTQEIILCWPIWIIASSLWIFWSIKKREWSMLSLWAVYTIMNVYGWYQWTL